MTQQHNIETRNRLSLMYKAEGNPMYGKTPWNKGKPWPKEILDKLSTSHKGQIPWNKGMKGYNSYPRSELWKKRISDSSKGKIITQGSIDKCRITKSMLPKGPFKNTKPERFLQSILTTNGIKFKKHIPIRGTPDIFIEPNICVFVDGEYWHSKPSEIERDCKVNEFLLNNGFRVIRISDTEIRSKIDSYLSLLL